MNDTKIITANSNEEIWQQIGNDLTEDLLEYHALIKQGGKEINLDIDIDFGGGFEGGYAETAFVSLLDHPNNFKFGLHKEGLGDEIGKFFGMQDVLMGYAAFDERFIVKTNNATLAKKLFNQDHVRSVLLSLDDDFIFGITSHDHKKVLEFTTETALTDPGVLKKIFEAFYAVLVTLDDPLYHAQ